MHTDEYLVEVSRISHELDRDSIEKLTDALNALRSKYGRLFIIGLGGSAANASHAANDFTSICRIKTTCLSDNVAELTACANDFGWANCYKRMLINHNASSNDALMVLSVGGGTNEVSLPLNGAIDYARAVKVPIFGIVGKDGGYTKKNADICVMVPTVEPRITPHTEAFQSVILHLLASHPKLQVSKTKW